MTEAPAAGIVEELRTASRECSGYEPSLSVLQEVADRAATEIEALTMALRQIATGTYDGLEVDHYNASHCRRIARAVLRGD